MPGAHYFGPKKQEIPKPANIKQQCMRLWGAGGAAHRNAGLPGVLVSLEVAAGVSFDTERTSEQLLGPEEAQCQQHTVSLEGFHAALHLHHLRPSSLHWLEHDLQCAPMMWHGCGIIYYMCSVWGFDEFKVERNGPSG